MKRSRQEQLEAKSEAETDNTTLYTAIQVASARGYTHLLDGFWAQIQELERRESSDGEASIDGEASNSEDSSAEAEEPLFSLYDSFGDIVYDASCALKICKWLVDNDVTGESYSLGDLVAAIEESA